eukprot:TRINITY_DN543_c0_g1_i5.p1 TRINITY_DN543_c0_g1~~TRINITY_DN543_c0_g1_i5.p1  ORF type:complete len:112 (-),score=4.46 TRINITY_DN543_c0_g1_i5:157-492(-)
MKLRLVVNGGGHEMHPNHRQYVTSPFAMLNLTYVLLFGGSRDHTYEQPSGKNWHCCKLNKGSRDVAGHLEALQAGKAVIVHFTPNKVRHRKVLGLYLKDRLYLDASPRSVL